MNRCAVLLLCCCYESTLLRTNKLESGEILDELDELDEGDEAHYILSPALHGCPQSLLLKMG